MYLGYYMKFQWNYYNEVSHRLDRKHFQKPEVKFLKFGKILETIYKISYKCFNSMLQR